MSLLLNEFKGIEAMKVIWNFIRIALAKSSDFIFISGRSRTYLDNIYRTTFAIFILLADHNYQHCYLSIVTAPEITFLPFVLGSTM